jgi:AcrR family transcriptional regulator
MMKDRQSYHHGDLKRGLLDAAQKILQTSGLEGLSMRTLADDAGVSRTALYHHFQNKNALLCALAETGFRQQDRRVLALKHTDDAAMIREPEKELEAAIDSRLEDFEAFVLAYLEFAVQEPCIYDLMYGRTLWSKGAASRSLIDVSHESFKIWLAQVEVFQQVGLFPKNIPALRVAQASWAAIHGLCRQFNDGLYSDMSDMKEIARASVKLMGASV